MLRHIARRSLNYFAPLTVLESSSTSGCFQLIGWMDTKATAAHGGNWKCFVLYITETCKIWALAAAEQQQ